VAGSTCPGRSTARPVLRRRTHLSPTPKRQSVHEPQAPGAIPSAAGSSSSLKWQLIVLERLDIAETHAREAMRMDSQSELLVAHRLLARILVRKGFAREAVQELKTFLAKSPSSPDSEAINIEIDNLERQISSP
jgi:hypothetical protein